MQWNFCIHIFLGKIILNSLAKSNTLYSRAFLQNGYSKHLEHKINFYDDSDAIVFVHFDKPNAKAVLVNVSKNFDKNNLKYDYFRTNECQFILKVWF